MKGFKEFLVAVFLTVVLFSAYIVFDVYAASNLTVNNLTAQGTASGVTVSGTTGSFTNLSLANNLALTTAARYYPTTATNAISSLVAEIGSDTAVIVLQHYQALVSTEYPITTALDLSAKPNIFYEIQPGAQFAGCASGVTLYSPSNIIAQSSQQIFGSGVTNIIFNNSGIIYVSWFGASPTATATVNATTIQQAFTSISAAQTLGTHLVRFGIAANKTGEMWLDTAVVFTGIITSGMHSALVNAAPDLVMPAVYQGSQAPTIADPWAVGDIIWDITPVSGQPAGWMCSVAGTPGTWVAMANLP